MTSIENFISRSLREILAELPDGADIPKSVEFQTFLTGLDGFIPKVIGEIHPEMSGQSGDGTLLIIAHKTSAISAATPACCGSRRWCGNGRAKANTRAPCSALNACEPSAATWR